MNFDKIMEHNLPANYVLDISPTEFEKLVKDFLSEAGKTLPSFEVHHNVKEKAHDGTYQIDVKATFDIFGGSNIVVLVECKKYNAPVKREKVEILFSRLLSIGAHKGIIFSTSGFQQGAIEFAAKHGIALIRLREGRFSYETRSLDRVVVEIPAWADLPKYDGVYIHDIEENKCSISNLSTGHLSSLSDFIYN
ncbi:restriction endonuclease [Larkinella sp. VNQ87]|uniref:restriction endonuclease n=1 Tax=Larkinella sp. VNQ87 TaxID=3400921 RepID=UPI003C0C289B